MRHFNRICMLILALTCIASAQLLSTRYYWSDSIKVTTVAVDCTFTEKWDYVTFWPDSCNILYVAGAPDTSGFTQREPQYLYDGQVKSFGPATPLKRLKLWAASDSGTIWMEGYKRVRQQP